MKCFPCSPDNNLNSESVHSVCACVCSLFVTRGHILVAKYNSRSVLLPINNRIWTLAWHPYFVETALSNLKVWGAHCFPYQKLFLRVIFPVVLTKHSH